MPKGGNVAGFTFIVNSISTSKYYKNLLKQFHKLMKLFARMFW